MNKMEESVTSAATRALELLKQEKLVDSKLAVSVVSCDEPRAGEGDAAAPSECFVFFTNPDEGEDAFLRVHFKAQLGAELEATVERELRKQLKEQEWIRG